MEERARFLIDYAEEHAPVTVRGLYYQAEVHGVPGIDKTDSGYNKVQHQVLNLRRDDRLDYDWIADATRWMRKPRSFLNAAGAARHIAAFYRKSLWANSREYVEIWCEKDALAGVILPVTGLYDVPLMVARGFCSETFCYEAIASRGDDNRPYVVYYLGDFDRSGRDAATSLQEKLFRFGREFGPEIIFKQLAVTVEQVEALGLPTRPHKRKSAADKKWPFDFACELDAIPPDHLRDLVERAINQHLPQDQLAVLRVAEASERELLTNWANALNGGGVT